MRNLLPTYFFTVAVATAAIAGGRGVGPEQTVAPQTNVVVVDSGDSGTAIIIASLITAGSLLGARFVSLRGKRKE